MLKDRRVCDLLNIDHPIMNALIGPIRKAAAKTDSPDAIALWSGQTVGLIHAASTANVFDQ